MGVSPCVAFSICSSRGRAASFVSHSRAKSATSHILICDRSCSTELAFQLERQTPDSHTFPGIHRSQSVTDLYIVIPPPAPPPPPNRARTSHLSRRPAAPPLPRPRLPRPQASKAKPLSRAPSFTAVPVLSRHPIAHPQISSPTAAPSFTFSPGGSAPACTNLARAHS